MKTCAEQMGCKMNKKQGVTVSYGVNVCKVREEIENDLRPFVPSVTLVSTH